MEKVKYAFMAVPIIVFCLIGYADYRDGAIMRGLALFLIGAGVACSCALRWSTGKTDSELLRDSATRAVFFWTLLTGLTMGAALALGVWAKYGPSS